MSETSGKMSGDDASRQRIERLARSWVVYLHSGDADPQRVKEFEAWLAADLAHARAYRDYEQLMADLGFCVQAEASPKEIHAPRPSPRQAVARRPVLLAAAAILAAVLTAGGLWTMRPAGGQPAATSIAEIRNLTLADGTHVTLGADSRIEVKFSDGLRVVTLQRGEAFFDVAPDKSHPFYVAVGDRLVRVVGTRFDVRKGADEIKVAVVEGVVQVLHAEDAHATERRLPDIPKEELRAGDQVKADIGEMDVERDEIEPEKAASWRRGWLSYDDAPLAEIVADANRYTHRRIELDDAGLGEVRVTAAFGSDQVDQFIAGLEASQPIAADRSEPARIVLRSR